MIRRRLKGLRQLVTRVSGEAAGNSRYDSYRQWWDASSPTMEAAYAATIAPTSETEYQSRGWNGDVNSYGARQLIEKGGLDASSRVLEIGCGIARIGREMAPRVAEWHGADISPNMIRLARQRTAHLPNVFFHELGPAGLADLPSGRFDFVYCTIVLMHLDKEDLFEYLRQAHRLVAEGGRAYFDTWNVLHPDVFMMWRRAAAGWLGDAKPRGRFQCCAPDEFCLYLEEAGFQVDSVDRGERLVRAFCSRVTGGPLPLDNDHYPPFGYVASPPNEAEVRGTVTITGWVLDRIARVEVQVGSLPPVEAQLNRPYAGMTHLFPRYPERDHSGFECSIDTTRLPDGHHEVLVTATDVDGRQTRITGEWRGLWSANGAPAEQE